MLSASLGSKAMDVSFSHCTFSSNEGSFVEVYLHVIGKTVSFVSVDSTQSQAAVEVLILFQQGDNIVAYDKYNLQSPLTSKASVNFLDQKRFGLENGTYELIVETTDVNNPENKERYTATVELKYHPEKYAQSDIQLLGAFKSSDPLGGFTKNGYYLETLPFNFYNKKADKLAFYNEIYNSDKVLDDEFLIRYFIDEVGNNETRKTIKLGHKKRMPKSVNVLLMQMDIRNLKSGSYYLTVEIRDRNNELLSSKETYFQRSNPFLDSQNLAMEDTSEEFVMDLTSEELVYGLKAIAMQVKDRDVELLNLIIKEKKLAAMRTFLFSYWANRSPIRPEEAYNSYMTVARAADRTFKSGMGYGFESDRGNIFMKYGKPNDMVRVDNELNAPPYEIWVYESFPFTGQSRVKFMFYNPTLGGGEFQLLHSTARGEQNNPQWEIELYSDSPDDVQGTNFVDATQMEDSYLRRARRLWDDL